jgi:predicted Rossmann fold nucleotide-binding protein DprA/Smf involved in DNA uptake
MEIKITRPNEIGYPKFLRKKLRDIQLPDFYFTGDLSLLDGKLFGMAGSRDIDKPGIEFAKSVASNAVTDGFGVVSGGARGVDFIARQVAIDCGGILVEFVPDSLKARAENKANSALIESGKLLMLSDVDPTAEFTGKAALRRNKYIYVAALGAIVVRCDYEKGGSWSGALFALKRNLCSVYTWNNRDYEGNQGLISRGVTGVDANWRFAI